MAPEVMTKQKYSQKADVYSFAIVMIEVFTGITPYEGVDVNKHEITMHILKGLRPDTSRLPNPLVNLVHDCWNDNPRLRPSFSEIIHRLRRLRDMPSILAPTGVITPDPPTGEFKNETTEDDFTTDEDDDLEYLAGNHDSKDDWMHGRILSTDFPPLDHDSIKSGQGVPFSLN